MFSAGLSAFGFLDPANFSPGVLFEGIFSVGIFSKSVFFSGIFPVGISVVGPFVHTGSSGWFLHDKNIC